MAKTKLTNLQIDSVDLVDAGANKDAYIKMAKRKPQEEKPVTKEHQTFSQTMSQVTKEKIYDELWDITRAFRSSLESVMNDPELTQAGWADPMKQSLTEFVPIMSAAIDKWAAGNTALAKSKEPEGTSKPQEVAKSNPEKGDLEDMIKINKGKMTAADALAYNELIKKYAVEVPDEDVAKATVAPADNQDDIDDTDDDTSKACKPKAKACKTTKSEDGEAPESEDVYKGLNPAVRAELESLKKFKEEAETRELTAVAKKYEILGKKTEELVPTLKSLKAAGGTAYNDMIAVLDASVDAVNKAGVFSEVGKSTGANPVTGSESAWGQLVTKGKEIQSKNPTMSLNKAIDLACEQNPDLVSEYENE